MSARMRSTVIASIDNDGRGDIVDSEVYIYSALEPRASHKRLRLKY
jgi:hypothetical protein